LPTRRPSRAPPSFSRWQRRWIDGVTIPTITTSSDAEAVPAVEAFLHTLLQK
jgi:hypothetical protein